MKISLDWIKDYVVLPSDLTPAKIQHDLTMSTVEVEGVEDAFPASAFANIQIGEVLDVKPATSGPLAVVQVAIGNGKSVTVACGASNVRQGMIAVIALPGAKVRVGKQEVEIQPVQRAGISSEGMLCSPSEIGLEKFFRNTGEKEILDLSSFNASAGDDVRKVLGLDDPIFVVDNKSLTHRPDLWGHFGIARELAAIYGCPMKPLPLYDLTKTPKEEINICKVEEASRFMAIQVDSVEPIETPYLMRSRLEKIDQDTHNILVDITNYVMFAVGQPSHAFDRKTLEGPLQVRFAKQDEKLLLLGNTEFDCASTDLVVADSKKGVALAGIKGGLDTSVTSATRDITLEFANFDSGCIRKTSKARNMASGAGREIIRSEASSRFEKSLDPELPETASRFALSLLTSVFPNAKIVSYADHYPRKPKIVPIEVTIDFLQWRVGMKHSLQELKDYLEPLGFKLEASGNNLKVTPPTWRATGDIKYPEDIVEEVARLCGYEKLDFVPLATHYSMSVNQSWARLERKLAEHLAYSCGMNEVFTYPWVDEKYLKAAKVDLEQCVSLGSPPSPAERYVQSSLVPQMLFATTTNLRYYSEFRLFQISKVFKQVKGKVEQSKSLSCALAGDDAMVLFRTAKGILESIGPTLQIGRLEFEPCNDVSWAQKGLAVEVNFLGKRIGALGVASKDAKFLAGIKNKQLVCLELDIDAVLHAPTSNHQYVAPPTLPVIEMDISVVVDEPTSWKKITESIGSQSYGVGFQDEGMKVPQVAIASKDMSEEDRIFVEGVRFVDEFRSQQVGEGKKVVTFRMQARRTTTTLTKALANELRERIVAKLAGDVGATLRA